MKHRLEPLLNPESIAVLGASERAGSVGRQTVENLLQGKFSGSFYAVNPGYESVLGVPCYPELASLPEPVEQVIFTISDTRVEAAIGDVISHGAKAATIMSGLVLKTDPGLKERVIKKIESTDMLVCGANSMGFYNLRDAVWACGFSTRNNHVKGGNVTLISQSGSGMSGILDCEERIDFNLAVSTGQELSVTMDDYIDYALEQPETRVIGIFMETVRNPDGMRRVLRKAAERRIPIVAIKVGRTRFSARMAATHSGAIAGRDAAYTALFDRYGVQRVDDMGALVAALMLFAQPHPVGPGGLAAIHDSGGERQLLIDLADRHGVPLAEISEKTKRQLADRLNPGLPAVNPLDAWGAGGPDSGHVMEDCFAALMADEQTALGAVVHDRAPLGAIHPEYLKYIDVAHQATGKPAVLVANHQGSGSDEQAVTSTRNGFPVLDGLPVFLEAVKCVFAYRDFHDRVTAQCPDAPAGIDQKWRSRLASGATLDEAESMALLTDFGLPMNSSRIVNSESELSSAATAFNYPLVLKTAQTGVLHKTESGGVILDIANELSLLSAYREMAARLGNRALLSSMITAPAVEMVLGAVRDEQFGLLVMLGFGGVHVEALKDVAYALPPFDSNTARRLIENLKLRPLLDPHRGMPGADIDSFCTVAAQFSLLVAALAEVLNEVDINPVIVRPNGCIGVDALVSGRAVTGGADENRRTG